MNTRMISNTSRPAEEAVQIVAAAPGLVAVRWMQVSLIYAALASSVAGCMSQPRDHAQVYSTDQAQEFSGYVTSPGGSVEVQVLTLPTANALCSVAEEGGGTWTAFATIPVATTASFTDDCGVKWYAWKKTQALKNTSKHWCDFGGYGGLMLQARYRAMWSGQVLKTFSPNAESTCKPTKRCGANVIKECGASGGVARLDCLFTTAGGQCAVKY